ncbi:MAG: 50S ribosomal protein L29 [Candidatus Paceibacterota bacterium]
MSDIVKKTDAELVELVEKARETVRLERFKDKFSRKASIINNAKKEIARALTELTARRSKTSVK